MAHGVSDLEPSCLYIFLNPFSLFLKAPPRGPLAATFRGPAAALPLVFGVLKWTSFVVSQKVLLGAVRGPIWAPKRAPKGAPKRP